MLHLKLVYVGL